MTATDHAVSLVHTAARAASDKLAQHILAFDVSDELAITDAFLLASATNDRQVKAIANPERDWRLRLVAAFARDVHEYHRALGADAPHACFGGIEVPEHARGA